MKLEMEKMEIKKIAENICTIDYENNKIKFWCNKLCLPFGLEDEYGKKIIKVELEDKNDNHVHLKKVIKHIEKMIMKKMNVEDEGEFKSVIKKRPNKVDMLELRIKTMKNSILTEIEYENKTNNYLKTIYDIPKQSYVKTQIEINGLWDYRTDKNEKNKIGLIVYVTKLIVLT